MNTTTLTCQKCASHNYFTEKKGNNNMAYCSDCKAFIKNIPYDVPKLYVGKYKGIPIDQIEDLDYLKWADRTIKHSDYMRKALSERISLLENLTR